MPNMHTKWQKPTSATIEYFNQLVAGLEVERRTMFGFPCAFINGNMFIWIHQNRIALRLPEPSREQLIAEAHAELVDPSGRRMREYVMLDGELAKDRAKALALVDQAVRYVASLPPKVKKPKSTPHTDSM